MLFVLSDVANVFIPVGETSARHSGQELVKVHAPVLLESMYHFVGLFRREIVNST